MSTHLITGVTGQDGVHLARLLRSEGGRVVGTHRPGSAEAAAMAPYLEGVELVPFELRDADAFAALVERVRPDEVYNLAAFSSVGRSWAQPEEALAVNGEAPAAMLEALARYPEVRFLQAASAEESGDASSSPYARGKAHARSAVKLARDQGRFAAAAVLHIHESPIRRPHFVVRKITRAVAEIAMGKQDTVTLGTLGIRRDWGNAADHVRAMRLMLQADQPGDFEVCTGIVHSLRDVVEMAFAAAAISDPWSRVQQDEALLRPQDTDELSGDPEPLRKAVGWSPEHTLEQTIARMVEVDIQRLESGVEEHPFYLV